MATLGTFDAFNASRMGIYAAQHGLHITGNNISNINTMGYTRQRVDQVSFKTGSTDRYASWMDNHMGNGVLVSGISQIRDPFLDIRYRTTATDTYYYDSKLSSLQNIASILDEVGDGDNEDGLIYAQLQDMLTQLRGFSANPTKDNDTLVRNSAESLASLFRFYASKLDELYANTETDFNKNITQVNEILTNIRDLNESIRDAEIHGDKALEMRDERNRQIDKLSQYMSIRVEYSYEDVGAGVQVEKLTIKMGNSNPDKNVHTDESVLVDGVYATQLSVPKEKPVLNTYKDEYLQGYTYLKKVSTGDKKTVDEFLAALNAEKDANYTETNLVKITETDENGKEIGTYYLFGTNDPDVEGIYTEKNDNYTIQLGQLLNRKGNVWKDSTTTWQEVNVAVKGSPTQWGFALDGSGLDTYPDGTNYKFVVDKTTYVIVEDDYEGIYIGDPADAVFVKRSELRGNKFAEFVAQKMNEAIEKDPSSFSQYNDYTISAKNGQLIFTSKKPGVVTEPPDLEVGNNADNKIGVGDPVELAWMIQTDTGEEFNTADYPQYKYDEHGNVSQVVNYVQIDDKWYQVTIDYEYTHEIALDDNDLHGILQAQREMLTEEGEFASAKDVTIDENACIKRGIPYYIKSLDLLAQKFAQAYNELNDGYMTDKDGYYIDETGKRIQVPDLYNDLQDVNSSTELTDSQRQNLINNGYSLHDKNGYAIDKNGNFIKDKNGNLIPVATKNDDGTFKPIVPPDVSPEDYDKLVVDLNSWLKDNGGVHMGGPLFSNSNAGNDTTGINAHNIDISAGWSNGDWGIVPKFETLYIDENDPDGMEHSTQNKNADHMVSLLLDKALTYDPRDLLGSDAIGPVLFKGTFNDMLSNMMGVEASDERITRINLTTSDLMLTELDYNREGVSGVDLNDEAMNMVQYQKAMNAAMRLMTAIDEALDRLINNTGIAGR